MTAASATDEPRRAVASDAGVVEIGRRTFFQVRDDDVMGMAGEMAFRFLLALPPMLIFLAALASVVARWTGIENPTDRVMSELGNSLPQDASSLVRGQLQTILDQQSGQLLSFGVIASLWAGSGGVRAVMKGMNRAYDIEETRPIWRRYALTIALTALLAVAIIAAFTLVVAGRYLLESAASSVVETGWRSRLIAFSRWPAAALILFLGIAYVYRVTPARKVPLKWVWEGAVLFVVGWLLATAALGIYVERFGSYSETYGTLGGVIVLMLWLYITSIVMLAGAELNAVLHSTHGREPVTSEDRSAEAGRTRSEASSRSDERERDTSRSRRHGRGVLVRGAASALSAIFLGRAIARTSTSDHDAPPGAHPTS
ncbi:MAG: YihY/virulence factor BrkB family protein [Dehalococcoidia bacterium]